MWDVEEVSVNRREREEFARIERELMEDPSFGTTVTARRPSLVPVRAARSAALAGVALGSAPLAIETGLLALGVVSVALSLLLALRWARMMRVSGVALSGPERRSAPLVMSAALAACCAVAVLVTVVFLFA